MKWSTLHRRLDNCPCAHCVHRRARERAQTWWWRFLVFPILWFLQSPFIFLLLGALFGFLLSQVLIQVVR